MNKAELIEIAAKQADISKVAAGKALDAYEAAEGKKVVTGQNFKQQIKEAKKKQKELKKFKPVFVRNRRYSTMVKIL